MMTRLKTWYLALSMREQRLVLAMVLIAIPILFWLLVWRPLSAAHDDALERYRLSLDRHGRIAAMAGVEDGGVPAPVIDGSLAAYLVDHAATRGLSITRQEDIGAGRAQVAIETVAPAEIAGWVAALEESGLQLQAMRMSPAGEKLVSFEATVEVR